MGDGRVEKHLRYIECGYRPHIPKMEDYRCIICLEGSVELRRLCSGCNESRVCQGCLNYVMENGFQDQVSNCPICKRPTTFQYEPVLRPTAQLLTSGLWYFLGLPVTPWKHFALMYATYNLCRGLCVRQDKTTENSPRSLVMKWNIYMRVIHIPYFLYLVFSGGRGSEKGFDSNSEDEILNEYLIGHFVTPLTVGLMIWIYKTVRRVLGR